MKILKFPRHALLFSGDFVLKTKRPPFSSLFVPP